MEKIIYGWTDELLKIVEIKLRKNRTAYKKCICC